jgi:hypothetical protein
VAVVAEDNNDDLYDIPVRFNLRGLARAAAPVARPSSPLPSARGGSVEKDRSWQTTKAATRDQTLLTQERVALVAHLHLPQALLLALVRHRAVDLCWQLWHGDSKVPRYPRPVWETWPQD